MEQNKNRIKKRNSLFILRKNMENLKRKLKKEYISKWDFMQENVYFNDDDVIKTYSITQNVFSLPFIWESQYFKDTKTHFFLELVHLFQTLETDVSKTISYRSHSQVFTSYALKTLARNDIIEIIFFTKDETGFLSEYEQMLGNNQGKEVAFYDVVFYKKRDLKSEDLPVIKALAKAFKIDFSQFQVDLKEEKIVLSLKQYYWKNLSKTQISMLKDILISIVQDVFLDWKEKEKSFVPIYSVKKKKSYTSKV